MSATFWNRRRKARKALQQESQGKVEESKPLEHAKKKQVKK